MREEDVKFVFVLTMTSLIFPHTNTALNSTKSSHIAVTFLDAMGTPANFKFPAKSIQSPNDAHLRLVVAAVDGVEHDLGVVAVGVGAGAEAVGVGDDARVLAHQGAVRRVLDRLPPQGQPLGRAEVLHGAEGQVGALVRGADAC